MPNVPDNKNKSFKYALASRCLYDDPDTDKKRTERGSLICIFDRLGLSNYTVVEGEAPDFLVTFSRTQSEIVVACELTTLYSDVSARGSPEKRDFELWKKIANKLRSNLDKAGHKYIYGVIFLKPDESKALRLLDNDTATAELETICPLHVSNYTEVTFPRKDTPVLNTAIEHVRLFRFEETGLLWWCAHLQSGEVSDPISALIETVTRKAKRAEKYSWEKADEKWLTIIAESNGLSDMAPSISDPEISKNISDVKFTRVILWDRWNEDLIQLYPTFEKICDGIAMKRHLDRLPRALRPFAAGGSYYPTKPRSS